MYTLEPGQLEDAIATAQDLSLHEYMYHGLKKRIDELMNRNNAPSAVHRKLHCAQEWFNFASLSAGDNRPQGVAYWLYHVRGAIREAHQILQDAGV